MEKITCRSCAHFHQHYGLAAGRIFRVHCGHCTYPKIRHKRPTANTCQYYASAPPDEDEFVSKEYLSKALLQHLLNMELLPPIEDTPTQICKNNDKK